MGKEQRDNWRLSTQIGIGVSTFFMPATVRYFALVAGNLLISALFPPAKLKDKVVGPSYGWKYSANTTANEDTPLPIVYGKARVKPVIKNRFVTYDGDKEYLNVLYGFTGHRIDEVSNATAPEWNVFGRGASHTSWEIGDVVRAPSDDAVFGSEPGKTYRCTKFHAPYEITAIDYTDTNYWQVWHGTASITDILVDGTPIDDLITGNSSDVRYETRPGLAEQSVIVGFENTYSNTVYNVAVYMDFPGIDKKRADIQIVNNRLYYDTHTLIYRGTTYTISGVSGAFLAYPGEYIYWRDGDDHYTTSTASSITGRLRIGYASRKTGNVTIYQSSQVPTDSDWYVIPTTVSNAQNIEATFTFVNGLYGQGSAGDLQQSPATIFAQYREVGVSTWTNFEFEIHNPFDTSIALSDSITGGVISRKTPNQFTIAVRALTSTFLDEGKTYQIRVTSQASTAISLNGIMGILYADKDGDGESRGFSYPGESLLGIKVLATGQLSGDIEVTGVVERSKVPVYNERTSEWVDAEANVHAWAIYDILANGNSAHPQYPNLTNEPTTLQPVYGCGIPANRLDYETFRSWAEYSRRPAENATTVDWGAPYGLGMKLNIVFDTVQTAWDAILQICLEGRGIVFPVGAKFYAVTDKPVTDVVVDGTTDKDVQQLFSEGNINIGTFRQQWADKTKKANAIEVVYFDETNNYERTSFAVRTSDWDTSTELNAPLQLTLEGTTAYAQAFAYAVFMLNSNELLNQVVVFESDIEALQAQVGDVIRVQKDSMVGSGGKVVSYSTGTVTLDKTVALVAGTTYEFLIQLSDGSLRMKSVIGTGDTTTLNVGTTWPTDPAKYDSWAFGTSGGSSKLFRILDITMGGQYGRQFVCLEYNANVYKSDLNSTDTEAQTAAKLAAGDYAPAADISVASAAKVAPELAIVPISTYNTASNLRLVELISRNRTTGEYYSSILAAWENTDGENWGEWEVTFRDVDVSDNDWKGDWDISVGYSTFDKVYYDGNTYVSMIDNNTGNLPK